MAVLSSDKNNISLNFTSNRELESVTNRCGLQYQADTVPDETRSEPGVQAWSGTGGYDGQDSRRKIHGGKAVENQDDGYKVPPAFAMEFHSSESQERIACSSCFLLTRLLVLANSLRRLDAPRFEGTWLGYRPE